MQRQSWVHTYYNIGAISTSVLMPVHTGFIVALLHSSHAREVQTTNVEGSSTLKERSMWDVTIYDLDQLAHADINSKITITVHLNIGLVIARGHKLVQVEVCTWLKLYMRSLVSTEKSIWLKCICPREVSVWQDCVYNIPLRNDHLIRYEILTEGVQGLVMRWQWEHFTAPGSGPALRHLWADGSLRYVNRNSQGNAQPSS